jgi:DNA-binding HxlR family transcriptional regulator
MTPETLSRSLGALEREGRIARRGTGSGSRREAGM